jgi:hypothetical protein
VVDGGHTIVNNGSCMYDNPSVYGLWSLDATRILVLVIIRGFLG